jgi:hypothetical protein
VIEVAPSLIGRGQTILSALEQIELTVNGATIAKSDDLRLLGPTLSLIINPENSLVDKGRPVALASEILLLQVEPAIVQAVRRAIGDGLDFYGQFEAERTPQPQGVRFLRDVRFGVTVLTPSTKTRSGSC